MDKIVLAFEPRQLDYVISVLSRCPWGEVAPIMADIQMQVDLHNKAIMDRTMKQNGEDKQELKQ